MTMTVSEQDKLFRFVRKALDNAWDNGYNFVGMSLLQIAQDMKSHDADIEPYGVIDILEALEKIRELNGRVSKNPHSMSMR